MRPTDHAWLLVAGTLGLGLAACAPSGTPEGATSTVPMTGVIRIPVVLVVDPSAAAGDPSRLPIIAGAEDELPRGPSGFDLLPDGGFVISDPVGVRLVFFDPAGVFVGDLELPFSPAAVTVLPDGIMECVDARSGSSYAVNEAGGVQALAADRRQRSAEEGRATLLDSDHGRITLPRTRGSASPSLDVRFDADTLKMISLQTIGQDDDGSVYVALETTAGDDSIDVVTIIRRYGPDGEPRNEIRDVPADYLIYPTPLFRVRNRTVYQMVPTAREVRINYWTLRQ